MKVNRQKRLRSHFRQLLHKSLRSRESILSYTRKIRLQTDRLRDFTQSLLHSCEAITNVDKNFVDEDIEIYQMADSSSDDENTFDTRDTRDARDTRDNAPPNDQTCEPSSSQTLTTSQARHGITAARNAKTPNWTASVVDPIVISDDGLERNPPTPFSLSELLGAPLRPPGSPAVRLDRTQADRTIENDQLPPEEMSVL